MARAAIAAKEATSALPIMTELQPPREWYAAEWYHQNYQIKNRFGPAPNPHPNPIHIKAHDLCTHTTSI